MVIRWQYGIDIYMMIFSIFIQTYGVSKSNRLDEEIWNAHMPTFISATSLCSVNFLIYVNIIRPENIIPSDPVMQTSIEKSDFLWIDIAFRIMVE